jgi:hypothetical protein
MMKAVIVATQLRVMTGSCQESGRSDVQRAPSRAANGQRRFTFQNIIES